LLSIAPTTARRTTVNQQRQIRTMRKAAAMSVEALAHVAGVHPATLKRAEAGHSVSDDTVWRLTLACKHALENRALLVDEARSILAGAA